MRPESSATIFNPTASCEDSGQYFSILRMTRVKCYHAITSLEWTQRKMEFNRNEH